MTTEYRSKYGKIVKRRPGLHEYWFKGRMIAVGSAISSANPSSPPTPEDWQYCREMASRLNFARSQGRSPAGFALYLDT